MTPSRGKQRHAPEQLSLPGTLPVPPTIEDELESAVAYIHTQRAEYAELQQQLREVGRQLREAKTERSAAITARLIAEGALQTAQITILLLESRALDREEFWRQQTQTPPVDQSWLLREMTRLLTLCHPDKWQGSPVAEELTKHVLEVRQRLMAK